MKLLKPLLFHLERANNLYKCYLKEPDYLHARTIFRANSHVVKTIDLILNEEIDKDLRKQLMQLQLHLDFWFEQFRAEEFKLNPDPDTKFQFSRNEDMPPFPPQIMESLRKSII